MRERVMKLDLAHYRNRHSKKSKIARALWFVVWLFLFRPTISRSRFFVAWRIWLLRLFGAKIGRWSVVMSSCRIWQPWRLEMGDFSNLGERVDCYSVDRIVIGNQVVVSDGAYLCGASHDITSPTMDLMPKPIILGDGAWVAARAIILPGVTVGEGAVVGAGSVVTKDVAPWTVVAGNPAREIKKRVLRDE